MEDGQAEYSSFLEAHKYQLESSGVPNHLWMTLFQKIREEIFDAGNYFVLVPKNEVVDNGTCVNKVLISNEEGMTATDPQNIFLVDHAWTFEGNKSRNHLEQIPGLLERMASLMNINPELTHECKLEQVCKALWKYSQTYSINVGEIENRMPLWYIVDEFGSSIQHSNNPNFRMIPFYNIKQATSYSLLFPVKDVEYGDEVTRDCIEGPLGEDTVMKRLLLIPWVPTNMPVDGTFEQVEPDEEYFISGHVQEVEPGYIRTTKVDHTKVLKVYSDYAYINNYLNDVNFEITTDFDEADILWLTNHFVNYKELSENHPTKYINQFPYEYVITVKDLLCIISRRITTANKTDSVFQPNWLPITFNLKTELQQFINYYQYRHSRGLDNHWICKPWNLARGLDTHITNNLHHILRLPFSGPKIAQKYIEKPVLFERAGIGKVKFDIRYVVLLKSVRPLSLYCYKNFFLRFSNKPFSLSDLDDYEKHFTVMNYNQSDLLKMLSDEFKIEFNKQLNYDYEKIEKDIFKMLKELFEGAMTKDPPCGIGSYPQSRALYAMDVMLSYDDNNLIIPQLLEVNWMPDCQRACQYYPDFYNSIFLLLFKDVDNEELFQKL